MDFAKAARPGRAVQRVNVDFPVDLLREIDQEARRLGVTRQASSRSAWPTLSRSRCRDLVASSDNSADHASCRHHVALPPELFNLMVDAIPLLNKSKRDVLLPFRGAGYRKTSRKTLRGA